MKKNFFLILISILLAICLSYFAPQIAQAAQNFSNVGQNIESGATAAGLIKSGDPILIAAAVIQTVLGLTGIIFFIYFLFGGFKYMTAAGADDKILAAKKVIIHAVIGLAIVTTAYAISYFVVNSLEQESDSYLPEDVNIHIGGD